MKHFSSSSPRLHQQHTKPLTKPTRRRIDIHRTGDCGAYYTAAIQTVCGDETNDESYAFLDGKFSFYFDGRRRI